MATNSFIAPSSPLDRRHLGKYEVLCRLSTGGMSAIYLAHQVGLAGFKKLVVLKTILPDIGGEEDFVGMFLEEARITAVFNHPNIAQVFELDTDEGQLYMAMEFVQGCTLVEMARACRQAKEPIPVGFTLASTRDTALALHYAHNFTDARGRKQIVIHRDVAEKNIMVTYEGVTKLLDFGIAKALGRSGRTSIGMVKGTSGYMSPEQIRGEPLDPRSDIFALGVVMHECLTGLRLFHGKTAEEGMMAALREQVQPPSRWNKEVGPELDAVVLKALERDRDKRFSTALEFARAIEKAAPGLLWHPEQLGELVTRHFGDRRAETRRLLESAEFGSETTGEVRVQSVLAKVRASAEKPAEKTPERRASLISAPKVSMPDESDEMTRPGVMPNAAARQEKPEPGLETNPGVVPAGMSAAPRAEPATNPARPKALRTSNPNIAAPPVASASVPQLKAGHATAHEPALVARSFNYDDDDDVGDKTIPATSLPDEIKNLRAQFASRRNAATVASGTPVTPNDGALTARDKVLTDRTTEPARPVERPAPPRTMSGETISITNKGNPGDWEDDDGAKTAVARPGDIPGMAEVRAAAVARRAASTSSPGSPAANVPTPVPATLTPATDFPASSPNLPSVSQELEAYQPPSSMSGADFQPTADYSRGGDSVAELEAVRPRRTGLVLLLVVLGVLAVLGVLVLLDVIPIPKLGAADGARATQLERRG